VLADGRVQLASKVYRLVDMVQRAYEQRYFQTRWTHRLLRRWYMMRMPKGLLFEILVASRRRSAILQEVAEKRQGNPRSHVCTLHRQLSKRAYQSQCIPRSTYRHFDCVMIRVRGANIVTQRLVCRQRERLVQTTTIEQLPPP
jgi:hypothetical protein